jgi:peroxiredoxin
MGSGVTGNRSLVVVGVNTSESAEVAKKYFTDEKLPFVNLLDPDRQMTAKYGGTNGIPKVVLIDKAGVVRFYQQGRRSNRNFRAEVLKLVP